MAAGTSVEPFCFGSSISNRSLFACTCTELKLNVIRYFKMHCNTMPVCFGNIMITYSKHQITYFAGIENDREADIMSHIKLPHCRTRRELGYVSHLYTNRQLSVPQ